MCVNYRPATPAQLHQVFNCPPVKFAWPEESFPGYSAPMIVGQEALRACFGLIPHWARDTRLSRSTYNARSETVAEKPSFRQAWRRGQFCLVPMQAFYEPNYEGGAAVRWRIERRDRAPFAVAGLWDRWLSPTREVVHSFTLLTLNADGHPLMGRFHKPGDEKRSLAVLAPAQWGAWMQAKPEEASGLLQTPDEQQYHCEAAPLPRATRARPSTAEQGTTRLLV